MSHFTDVIEMWEACPERDDHCVICPLDKNMPGHTDTICQMLQSVNNCLPEFDALKIQEALVLLSEATTSEA